MRDRSKVSVQSRTEVLTDSNRLRKQVISWRLQGFSIALVPTMGALHNGHIELVKRALLAADRVIVSIFVNPTQFSPEEDFSSYPRRESHDRMVLDKAGADIVYIPNAGDMYPKAFQTKIEVAGLSEVLCGRQRPRHFSGVATIVVKLLQQSQADFAIFGEKDFQQLALIKQLVTDLDIPVTIIGVPTIRAKDGLALSSRNAYLTKVERALAPKLYSELLSVAEDVVNGEKALLRCKKAKEFLLQEGFIKVDYIEIRDCTSLSTITNEKTNARIFGAAYLGNTRLLDNVPLLSYVNMDF